MAEKLTPESLEMVARVGYDAMNFLSDPTKSEYWIVFPDMLKAARFAHAPKVKAQYRVEIENIEGHRGLDSMQDTLYRPVMVWVTER
jgi:hypothetical protein